jgi:cytochrome c-type biogenesis protein
MWASGSEYRRLVSANRDGWLDHRLGLGIPFLMAAVSLQRMRLAIRWIRANQLWVTRFGGAMLMAIGIMILTGTWDVLIGMVRGSLGGVGTAPV